MADKIVSTAQAPEDDSPTFDDDGYTALRPSFDEQAALDALENPSASDKFAQLPPQEAYDAMKFQAPLSPGELQILRETPFLGPELTFVDDADHEEWLRQTAKDRTKAMDKVLEDQMYGQATEEPGVSAQGDELGWGLSSLTHLAKKAAGGVARGAQGVARGAGRVASTATHALANVVKTFVPGRDAQKAALVRSTYARLTQGRANFLQMAAVKAGQKNVPRATYEAQARAWAKGRLQAGGLPTSTIVGEVATQILGDDVMGSWWNPFSWFQTQVKYVVQNAQGQIAEMSPADFQAWQQQQGVTDPNAMPDPSAAAYQDPSATPYQDPNAAAAYQDPNAAYQDPNAAYPTDDQQGEEEVMSDYDLVFGEDDKNVDLIFGDESQDYDLVVGNEHAFSGWADDALGHGRHGKRRAKRVISAGDYQKLTLAKARSSSAGETPSTQALVTAHRQLASELPKRGVRVARPADTSGAWLYKLDPRYWLASTREKALIDAEKRNWEKTQDLKKRTGKQKGELEAGRRALYQAEQARAAEAESQAVDTELKDIEESVASGVGGDSIVGAATAEGQVQAKKNARKAGALADKIEAGEKLSPQELGDLRNCLKMCRHLRKLHDALHQKTADASATSTTSGYHDSAGEDLVGDPVTEILGRARRRASVMGAAPITPNQWVAMTALAVGQPSQLPAFLKTKNLRLSAADVARLRKATAAAKAIMKHPQYSRATVRGEDGLSGDDVGFSFLSAFKKVVTAPLALAAIPAAGIAWGMKKIVDAPTAVLNYGAKWGGWGKPGASGPAPIPGAPAPFTPSPQDVAAQQARINAANQRRQAAMARQQAAMAQSAQAQQEYAAQAAAADAEAAAADAEAQAQQDASDAQMAQYGTGPTDDQSGSASVIGAAYFTGAFVGEVTDEKAKAIIVEAQKNTPTGKKIRAGATLYHKAKKGDPKARLAVAKMEAKAKKGDKQAQHDVNAVKAGKIALAEKGRAQKKIAAKARREARGQTIHQTQNKIEVAVANRLARGTRKRKLAKIAKVERMAAKGHPKAKAAIAKTVAKAHAGDPKAKTTVEALRLAKHVRVHAKTPADARRLKQAGKLVAKANRGNKKAIRQLALIQSASKQGQPNAKRAMKHIVVAAHVEKTLATGKVHAPSSGAAASAKKTASAKKRYAFIKGRVTSGIATKEEALAGAKLASAMAKTASSPTEEALLKKEAAALALRARSLRPAAQPIKDAAAVRTAAKGGNKEAQQVLSDTLAAAQRGDPKGISGAGKLAAVEAVDAVKRGQPMSPEVAEAVGIVERAHAGDPEAKRIVARAGAAAQSGDQRGVETAVALTAASAVLAATAANAAANKHFRDKAREVRGHKVDTAEQGKVEGELSELVAKLHEGTATRREGVRARELAMALGKTKLAAEISAIMPPDDSVDTPLSSLPDHPLPAITGFGSFLREGIKALLLATDDPLANYRAGVQSRGATAMLPPISETKPKT